MPSQKSKKTLKVIKPLRSTEEVDSVAINSSTPTSYSFISKLVIIALFGTISYLLAFKYRSLILVATVNNTPISRFELNQKMAERYGKQTVEELISEKILNQQISNNKIVVTDEEVKAEMDKMLAQYGSQDSFNAALEQFGLTEEKARQSVKQSMGFKKLIEKNNKIEITDTAVKEYFESNKDTSFKGKKFEEVSATIKDSLYQQELYTKSQEMFTNLRKEAKVNTFIK